jgi:hypothetical protein
MPSDKLKYMDNSTHAVVYIKLVIKQQKLVAISLYVGSRDERTTKIQAAEVAF